MRVLLHSSPNYLLKPLARSRPNPIHLPFLCRSEHHYGLIVHSAQHKNYVCSIVKLGRHTPFQELKGNKYVEHL